MQQSDLDPNHLLPRNLLPRDLYDQVVHALRLTLPLPAGDRPEDAGRRDYAAIAQVASLLPANGEEALLAVQYVVASAHALDCLRLARQYPADLRLGLKYTAQAASMMRQACGARTLLASVQASRRKREANPAALEAAARVEQRVARLMADALATAPVRAGAASPKLSDRMDDAAGARAYASVRERRTAPDATGRVDTDPAGSVGREACVRAEPEPSSRLAPPAMTNPPDPTQPRTEQAGGRGTQTARPARRRASDTPPERPAGTRLRDPSPARFSAAKAGTRSAAPVPPGGGPRARRTRRRGRPMFKRSTTIAPN